MTRTTALKRMRRLYPSVARREAFARTTDGMCEVGVEIRSERGDMGRAERVRSWRAGSWEEAFAMAQRATPGPTIVWHREEP